MRRKTLCNAKLIIKVESNKSIKQINTISVFDNRIQEFLPYDFIQERGITTFLNLDDMKESLNWNLNGDSLKYQFKWGMSVNGISEGVAYIFD